MQFSEIPRKLADRIPFIRNLQWEFPARQNFASILSPSIWLWLIWYNFLAWYNETGPNNSCPDSKNLDVGPTLTASSLPSIQYPLQSHLVSAVQGTLRVNLDLTHPVLERKKGLFAGRRIPLCSIFKIRDIMTNRRNLY